MKWFRRKSREDDLERELQTHLQLEAEELGERGVPSAEARYAARRALGNITATKEEVRRMWGWSLLEVLFAEIRYALRNLRKNPGFAAVVVLTLTLAIGASTAVFTLVDSVLLKPLSFRESGQLVVAWEHVRFMGGDPVGPNPKHVEEWRKRTSAFTAFASFLRWQTAFTSGPDRPRLTGSVLCSPNLFDVLEAQPLLGRLFQPRDGVKGHDNVAVLSYPGWRTLFDSDPRVIGRTIRVDDNPVEIIGVLPPDFHFPAPNALQAFVQTQASAAAEETLFMPAVMDYAGMEWAGNYGNWVTVGRLKPGASIREAESQINGIQRQLVVESMGIRPDQAATAVTASLQPMQAAVSETSGPTLWFLMAAVLGLMLIACLNLANAQLGRALARGRDVALRTALGAAKWRLLWNGLAESLVLSAIGGVSGVLLAAVALRLIASSPSIDLPRLAEIRLNGNVLLFAATLTIAATLLSGLFPALRVIRADPQAFLQGGGGRTSYGSASGSRLRSWLIGLQAFGGVTLLLVTLLFAKSLLHLLTQDKGFDPRGAAIAVVKIPGKAFDAPQSRIDFIETVLRGLRALPGVESAGFVSRTPLDGESWIESLQRVDRPEMDGVIVNARWVSPGYFEATRQRLIAGRFFEERDRNLDSAVISEAAAKALWGNASPIGMQAHLLGRKQTVIGVVADSRITSLKTKPAKVAYVHYQYRTPYSASFIVRGAAVDGLMPGIRQTVWNASPLVAIARLKTFDAQLTDSLARERLQTLVLTSFAAAALLLAMLGIHGVLSYLVAARKQEIGVRMALGASKARVYRLTLAQAGAPVCIGLMAGLAASAFAGGALRKFLYGVEPVDPAVMALTAALFMAAATVAALLPARRAASVDPIEALRAE